MAACKPAGHVKSATMHWLGLCAPSATVDCPSGQGTQAAEEVAPTEMPYVPKGQGKQEEGGSEGARYVPTVQDKQAERPGEGAMAPAEHTAQAREEEAPARGEALPMGHCVQASAPARLLNVPGPQMEQLLMLAPPVVEEKFPGAQNPSHTAAPGAEAKLPAAQGRQMARPRALEKVPGAHRVGVALP